VVEGGTFGLRLGASSRDVRLSADVELPGDDVTPPLRPESTAEAWLAHPEAGPWLREQLADAEFGRLLSDPRNGQMLRAVPLVRLSRMPGFPVREPAVTAAAARYAVG